MIPGRREAPTSAARTRGSGSGWRLVGLLLRVVVPVMLTAGAAVLGYAFAVYPIWYHVDTVRRTESLGGFVTASEPRERMLGSYYHDSGLNIAALDDVAWAVRTVMTPFVGYGPAPGQRHNAYITANQFRGSRLLETPKPAGVTRVFLTGASVAFSAGAPSDDRTIGAYLQRALDTSAVETGRRYEVFTFATPAWSSTHERIGIENRLSELEPDVVISLTGVADALYGERGLDVLWARALTDQYYWELVNIALTRSGFEPMIDVQDVSPTRVDPELVARRLRKNVELGARALSMAKARLHVFLQPAIVTTGKPLSPREQAWARSGYFKDPVYYQACYDQIDTLLRTNVLPDNTAYTNLRRVFDGMPQEEDVFLDSYHFGDRGNDLMARAIASTLLRDSLPGPLAGRNAE